MERIIVAKISKPQGIKGELKCQVLTDVLDVFNGGVKEFYVSGKKLKAEKVSCRQGSVYIKFEGVNSRNDAELLRNQEISLDKQLLKQNLKDEFLVDDLIGLVLYDEEGLLVGQIVDFENYGASDILTILENGHEYEIPFISAVFITDGDKIIVRRKEYDETKL